MNDSLASPLPMPVPERRTRTVATISQTRQKRSIVLVLGMHRSGTSLCSHVLSALGIDMADEIATHDTNAKGHWERRAIVDLHDRVLDHFNRGFYSPNHDFTLPVAWWADPEVGKIRREIVTYLEARIGDGRFGFKDPRTARLLPMWHQILNELRLAPKFIICLRNPAQVARSLQARDGFDPEVGEYRWFAYVLDCFRYIKNHDICVLEYERWFDDPSVNLQKLREFVGPSALERDIDIDPAVFEIVDDQLRHDNPQLGQPRQPLIRSLYALARKAGENPAARQQIEEMAAQFLAFDQLQRAFRRAFEHNAEFALRVPVLQEEITLLQTTLAAREGALAAASSSLEQAVQRERAALEQAAERQRAGRAEAEQLRNEIGELKRLLQEAAAARAEAERLRQTAVQADRDKIAALGEALSEAETQLLQRGTEIEARKRTISELQDAIGESERKLREHERLTTDLRRALAQQERAVAKRRRWPFFRRARQHRVTAPVQAGDRAIRTGDWGSAIENYRRALERAPGLAPIWVQLGHALKEQGDLAGAEEAYRRALALDDAVADTHLQLGHLLKLRDRWEDAAEAYGRALELDPALRDAGNELDWLATRFVDEGDRARDSKNWLLAARCYRQALARKPELTPIWVQLGHALKEQRDYAEAETAYRRALDLDDKVADTHLQLGHLLKLQARRTEAKDAYAMAVRLDPDLLAARESLHALLGYSPAETERAIKVNGAMSNGAASEAYDIGGIAVNGAAKIGAAMIAVPLAGTPTGPALADRYGALFDEARLKSGTGHDVLWLGVIDWHFRIQRPQHLAANLADAGARIFYISLVFEPADANGRFRIIDSPHPGVFETRVRLRRGATESIYQGLSEGAVGELQLALDELVAAVGLRSPVVMVEHPAWHRVACGISGATVVYDCLDLATGFSNAAASLAADEAAIIANADLVIAASRPLAERIATQRSSVLIRNAAEVEFFSRAFTERAAGERPVIGYYGAIAEWFNIEWIENCAAVRPYWEFRLIGRTDGCDTLRASALPNVTFYGEKPYDELPEMLRDFDVAVIPFKLVELTRCTNPVKLYEYMAAGKAVVAARMPEVVDATDLTYIADDAESFLNAIEEALAEDSPALRRRRQAWAREHDWRTRSRDLAQAIDAIFPLVSVVVLTYNNWEYTSACLSALRSYTDYPNLEIIVVDNASTDGTRDKLRILQRQDHRLNVILNDTNLGFPGGNNVGLRAARGEFVVMLNNDTYVTRGWLRDLIRPLQRDPRIGLVGPLTNNIGNEQKIKLPYETMPEMQEASRRFVRARLRRTFETNNVAFFCVAMRRSVLEEVGLLDEIYGLGYYEDDDYCRRVRQAGYRIVIADDVFVHHHLGVSYDTLPPGAPSELMTRNRALFEKRWGPWQPHSYRDEPGFG